MTQITINKLTNNNIRSMKRSEKTLRVRVGNPGNGRAKDTIRLIAEDGSFIRAEKLAVLRAKMEIGKHYEIKAMVSATEKVTNAVTFEVKDITSATEVAPFEIQEFEVVYAQPESAPSVGFAGLEL